MVKRMPMGLLLSFPSVTRAMKRLTYATLQARRFTFLTCLSSCSSMLDVLVDLSLVLQLIRLVSKGKSFPLCFWRLLTLLAQGYAIFWCCELLLHF
jgi:hypothetical protein